MSVFADPDLQFIKHFISIISFDPLTPGDRCHYFHFTVEKTEGQRGSRGTEPWEGAPEGRREKKRGQERTLKPNLQSEGGELSPCSQICLGVARGMCG